MAQTRSTILFVASSPYDLDALNIDKEHKELTLALSTSRHPDRWDVEEARSIQPTQLSRILRTTARLAVMHFSGHGDSSGDFAFEDERGRAHSVSASALGDLLEMATTVGLRVVVLNSCYSDEQAQYIAEKVGVAVAMRGEIADVAAIAFTREFYSALGDAMDFSTANVQDAFNWAHSGLRLSFAEEYGKPRLFLRQRNIPRAPGNTSQEQGRVPLQQGQVNNSNFYGDNNSGINVGNNSGQIYSYR